jgi:ABC-type multidrug transport system ATPase subunit
MEAAVEFKGVAKNYGPTVGIHPLDYQIERGLITGLIGPDGAGKTTILRIISTVMRPDVGLATVLGFNADVDYRKIRVRIGYMPGKFALYQDLSVMENISFFASVFGVDIKEALRRVDRIYSQLAPYAGRRAGALSGGMKQKLALCCALVHKPELLLLDEPTTGVDAVSRSEFWDVLTDLNNDGMTVVVSTPYMDEASRCSSVSLIQNGRIMKSGSPNDIMKSHRGAVVGISASDKYDTLKLLRTYPYVDQAQTFGEMIHYTDKRNDFDPADIKGWLDQRLTKPVSIEVLEPSIEDVFIQMMLEAANAGT